MHAFSHLLCRTRHFILSWKSKGLNSIESNILKLKKDIMEVEAFESLNGINSNSTNVLNPLYDQLAAL